jgi:hypothetical protein
LNIYGHRTYAMKPAAKITTMTGRISNMGNLLERHNTRGPTKLALMDEGSRQPNTVKINNSCHQTRLASQATCPPLRNQAATLDINFA